MDFDALEYHHHGSEPAPESETHAPDAAEAAAPEETPARQARVGIFDQIAQSNFARSIALMAGAMIGGGSLSFISGCSLQEEAQVARAVEKEAKFSTLGENAQIPLHEMATKLEARQQIKTHVDELRQAVSSVVSQIEETQSYTGTAFSAVLKQIATLKPDIEKIGSEHPTGQLFQETAQLKNTVTAVEALAAPPLNGESKASMDTPAYLKLHSLQTELYEWSDALERDVGLLQTGAHAKQIAELANELESTAEHLNIFPVAIVDAAWLAKHPEEVNVAQALIQLDIKHLTQAENNPALASIREDLGDAHKLLKDLSHSLEAANQGKFFAKEAGKEISAGQALLKEARTLIAALHSDLSKELSTSIGAQAPAPRTVPQNAPATAASGYHGGGGHFHHYHMWYMPFNTYHGGYSSGYTYVPHQSYSYSGVNRLRSSPEYQSFSNATHEGHSVLGGKEGVTSHSKGSPSRSVVHGGDSHISSSPSHHTSGGGKVGGFNSGKSFSSGFGG